MKVFGIVYVIINMLNGKCYVGQTMKSLEERFKEHATRKRLLIGQAIKDDCEQNFNRHVLVECTSKAEMDEWERRCIVFFNSKTPNGYNQISGGQGGVPDDETRAKLRTSKIGEKNPNYGKHLPDETRNKMAEAQSGDKNHFFGKHHTLTTCMGISLKNRGQSPYQNLIAEMNAHRITYTALAKILGLTKSVVARKIRGEVNFTDKDKFKFVEIFGKTIEYLLQRDNK